MPKPKVNFISRARHRAFEILHTLLYHGELSFDNIHVQFRNTKTFLVDGTLWDLVEDGFITDDTVRDRYKITESGKDYVRSYEGESNELLTHH